MLRHERQEDRAIVVLGVVVVVWQMHDTVRSLKRESKLELGHVCGLQSLEVRHVYSVLR